MKAVAYQQNLPITDSAALQDVNLPEPVATGKDILVEVKAVSVNPVDAKVRASSAAAPGQWKVLGWDAAGVVRAVGPEVQTYKPGDRVWYAGDITRQGSNAELQVVDERIVGRMPESFDFADAAALPLTAITAWELLFDRFCLQPGKAATDNSLLIIGAAGGVGSIMLQLARRLTALPVIATASRDETREWVKALGASAVINHYLPLPVELKRIGIPQVTHIASLTNTDQHFAGIAEVIAPQGKFGLIDSPTSLDINKLKQKSVSLHWEFMFTRSRFAAADQIAQQHLLNELAGLVDAGLIKTTRRLTLGNINADNLKRAHALLESGQSCGKVVLAGF